ncbi:MAG: hypothetical protein RBS17_05020 [Coriobacteriia bacterium]|nr:hypothetical protein [Coriobacteriia bacterium]MDZ4179166.1 hypothetical protein [Coriobacteriia bacterium]
MVDTCVFNWLVSERISLTDLPGNGDYFATHVQWDELDRTPREPLRSELLARFTQVVDREVLTESAVVKVSRAGRCKVSDGVLFESIRSSLDSLNNSKSNNASDALIAEAAIVNGWVLITADRDLAQVAGGHECVVHLVQA